MSEYEPKSSWYAIETQRIANSLPQWMKARRERDSSTQKFLNPFGSRLDELNEQIELTLRNRFIELSNLNEPDQLRRVQIPLESAFQYPNQIVNHLLNGSFCIRTSHDRLPDYWRSSGAGQASIVGGILGDKAVQLSVGTGQSVTVYQEVKKLVRAGEVWGFYVWHISQATGLVAPATGFGLEIVGTHKDGSTETLRASFTADTGGYPKRALVRSAFSQDVVKWEFRVVVTNSAPFPITTPVTVDMAMAAEGSRVVDWRPHILDNYPYIDYYDRFAPVVSEHGTRAQFVERFKDFWMKAVPTRAGSPQLLSSGGTIDPTPSPGADGFAIHSTTGEHREVDFWKQEWYHRWQIGYDGSNPRVRAYGLDAQDVIGPFDLAFRNYRNWFEDGASWTPEAMTSFNGYLWAVIKKQDHLGSTRRYLAVIDPKFPRPIPSYLEVTAMIELTGISTSTSLSRAEVKFSDQQWLYVGDGASQWTYRLYYDYFLVDYNRKLMYFREDYEQVVPQLTVPARTEALNVRPVEA